MLIFDPTSVVIFILLVYPSLEVSVAHGYFCHALNYFFSLITHRMSSSDLATELPEAQLQHDSTIVVDKAVSLTLSSDSLLIVGKIHNCAFKVRDGTFKVDQSPR